MDLIKINKFPSLTKTYKIVAFKRKTANRKKSPKMQLKGEKEERERGVSEQVIEGKKKKGGE